MLAFRVARDLSRTVDELLRSISAAELFEWSAFYAVEDNDGKPLYPDPDDIIDFFTGPTRGK